VRVTARPQAIHHGDPLIVDAECAAACDLRAVVAPRGKRRPTGVLPGAAAGTGGRADAGRVRLRVEPAYTHIAPRGGGTVRVVVRATAPGGSETSDAVLRVRVRRRAIPPLRRLLDVRARRRGDAVIVRWRTAGPSRRVAYQAFGRRTRGAGAPRGDHPYAMRQGRGDRRFRLRLDDAARVRWVVLSAYAADPPYPVRRRIVRVR
jgi:hypothetical protein